MNWNLTITLHWPHDRLAIGWEVMHPVDEVPWTTIQVFLGIVTVRVDLFQEE